MVPEIIKILEENIGSKLFYMGLSNIFWIYLLSQEKQVKLNNFCTVKETINKVNGKDICKLCLIQGKYSVYVNSYNSILKRTLN